MRAAAVALIFFVPWMLPGQSAAVVIRAGVFLDGKGAVRRHVDVAVCDGRIQRIAPCGSAKPTYDLGALTLLPGLIDTHVHIAWHLGPDGRYQPRDASPASAFGYAAREALGRGVLPGPRPLTSIRQVADAKLPGLKIVFGTDAMAAAHGRNIEELIYRVQKGGPKHSQQA